jgi:hypothetical protein
MCNSAGADITSPTTPDNSLEHIRKIISHAGYFYKASVNVSIAVVAKNRFPFILYCAAIGEISETRPYKLFCFY